MRTDFEEYMTTGMVGSYQPEKAILRREPDGVNTLFRENMYEDHEDGFHVKRFMEVDGRRFFVTSVFPEAPSAKVTDKFLSYIDSELKKEAHSA